MAATVPAHSNGAERVLYIRTGNGVIGPYPYESVKEMARNGALPPEGAVSSDGHSWLRADKVLEVSWSYRDDARGKHARIEKKVVAGYHSSNALRELLEKVCQSTLPRKLFTRPIVFGVSFILITTTMALVANLTGLTYAVTMKRLILFMAFGIPTILGIIAVIVACGNALLKSSLGLDDTERRFLALQLPKPVIKRLGWGGLLRNWLFRGEWLFSPPQTSSRAYIHIFRSGKALETLGEEVGLWEGLSRVLPYSLRELCVPGDAIRQVQDVDELPAWSERISGVTDGYALGVVLDYNYVEWAQSFLARARKRLNIKSKKALEFVLSYIELEDGSKVLVVSVYPQVRKVVTEFPAQEEVSVLDEVSKQENAAA